MPSLCKRKIAVQKCSYIAKLSKCLLCLQMLLFLASCSIHLQSWVQKKFSDIYYLLISGFRNPGRYPKKTRRVFWVNPPKTIPGLFVPLYFSSREWKVDRENFRSRGTFVPWNIRSLELSFLWNFRSLGAKVPRTSVEHSLPWNFRSSGANVPRTFVPMKLSYHENEYSKNFPSKCPKTRPFNLTIAYYALITSHK